MKSKRDNVLLSRSEFNKSLQLQTSTDDGLDPSTPVVLDEIDNISSDTNDNIDIDHNLDQDYIDEIDNQNMESYVSSDELESSDELS